MGVSRPRRSERRPAIGLITASPAAVIRKIAPMAAPLAPRSSSRSGPSTSITPANSAGSVNSQKPASTAGLRSADDSCESTAPGSGSTPGVTHAHPASAAAPTATALNTISGPTTVAAPPSTGPSNTPMIAAASAEPISSPRRSGGAAETSQAMPAAHMQAPPTPWMKRAASSSTMWFANANTRLVTPSSPSPSSSVGLTPQRAASQPLGTAAAKVPAGYAAVSTPAPVFESPNSSAYSGSSGDTAAKKEVSTSTTAATSRNRRRIPPMLRTRSARGRRLGRRRSDSERMPAHARTPRRAHRLAAHPLRLHRWRRCARASARVRLGLRADRGGRRERRAGHGRRRTSDGDRGAACGPGGRADRARLRPLRRPGPRAPRRVDFAAVRADGARRAPLRPRRRRRQGQLPAAAARRLRAGARRRAAGATCASSWRARRRWGARQC